MSDLRGSGAIEQDADVIVMLHREDHVKEKKAGEPNEVSRAKLFCVKNRNGGTGDFELYYSPWIHRFEDPWKTLIEKEARQ